ncbi:MAG: Rid family detoxifying hydrolase [Saprospiraceae bacterium]|jgi:2-iminobutanoate/2-iminopropanoate deaminase|nr:Rid family detoxifying hydrolase [Saprospiraceae bacterium]|tara:strand:+ start:2584 stop:2964 length:381 start_codon:yes stop_codon:yes gene_type:complete
MKKVIFTPNAPAPVGPYSQAIMHGDTLYCSGQIALNPKTGELVTSDLDTETRLVFSNLQAVLEAADMTFDNVVKCSVFLSSMESFGEVNKIYAEYFDEATAPARETVEVANLPKYVNVEISAIAIK